MDAEAGIHPYRDALHRWLCLWFLPSSFRTNMLTFKGEPLRGVWWKERPSTPVLIWSSHRRRSRRWWQRWERCRLCPGGEWRPAHDCSEEVCLEENGTFSFKGILNSHTKKNLWMFSSVPLFQKLTELCGNNWDVVPGGLLSVQAPEQEDGSVSWVDIEQPVHVCAAVNGVSATQWTQSKLKVVNPFGWWFRTKWSVSVRKWSLQWVEAANPGAGICAHVHVRPNSRILIL